MQQVVLVLTLNNPTLTRSRFSSSNKTLLFPHSIHWSVHLTVRVVHFIFLVCMLSSKPIACYCVSHINGIFAFKSTKAPCFEDLVHLHCLFQLLRKGDEISTEQWQEPFNEIQLLWKSTHHNNEELWFHEHTLLLCPKGQCSVEIYNDYAFLEIAIIFFTTFFVSFSKFSILSKAGDAYSSNNEKGLLSQLEGI